MTDKADPKAEGDAHDEFSLAYENDLKDAVIRGDVLEVVRDRLENDPDKPAGYDG